ncbi:MAG: hypothetical protein AB7U81_04300 [Thiohalomonadaceae bacterium]
MSQPHLLVAISSHGFGHVAQVAPVIHALRERIPDLRLTLRTAVPRTHLEERIGGRFELQAASDDFGMVQTSALDVDVAASAQRYREFHEAWPARLAATTEALAGAAPDLVLADVPYLTLAAARRAGIPALALCSLNWHDIYGHYCGHLPEAAAIRAQMRAAYAGAQGFLCPTPSMPMPALANARAIGPIAARGRDRRADVARRAGLACGERLVLLAMGGIDWRPPMESWPRLPGVRFLVPRHWRVQREDVLELEALEMSFSDVLASCDALLTKPGYGSFAEAAAVGVPVLYVRRGDWPEEPALTGWLHGHALAVEVSREDLHAGRIASALERVFASPRPAPVAATGVQEAAAIVARMLER